MKAAGARQLQASELREKLIGNSWYVLLLKRGTRAPTGFVLVMYYPDDRHRVGVGGGSRTARSGGSRATTFAASSA